ncbi:TlpA disulfide reductase family protein [Geodermatophilus sp. DF01_2]|uniref:TlpA family protein disulfide reductase n=1 Tax=Geodermatophilus sp. DF01-2 TaxID=2559610 RepID=UPI0024757AE8|nr:TlpA disulfide reductase family protein [Geodermatophilus sp. DF01_2]
MDHEHLVGHTEAPSLCRLTHLDASRDRRVVATADSLGGPDVSLDHLTGRSTLVNLRATWCGACREEMPLLQDAHARAGEQIRFLGVDTQDDPARAACIQDLGVDYPQVVDPDGRLLAALGVRRLPVSLAIEAHGLTRSVSADEAGP